MGNMTKVRVLIRGTRPLLQHAFTPDTISLEDKEKTGRAGNDPIEWTRSKLVTEAGELYVLDSYIFGMMRDAAKYTKKGRGSYQTFVSATLQVLETVIPLGRHMPDEEPKHNAYSQPVYIDVRGARNPSTKQRNVRYRLACSPGWECAFTMTWDKTIVPRLIMRAILNDASALVGLADGRGIGMGRFEVIKWEEEGDAEETPAERNLGSDAGESLPKGRRKVRSVQTAAAADNGEH